MGGAPGGLEFIGALIDAATPMRHPVSSPIGPIP
jgi:hypothetical protein